MALKLRGVMQSPVTPPKENFGPDPATFEKVFPQAAAVSAGCKGHISHEMQRRGGMRHG